MTATSNGVPVSRAWNVPRSGNRYWVAIALCCLSLLVLAGCASGPPKKPENICSVFDQKYGWHKASLKLQKKWDIPFYIPMAIMAQESSFRAKAKPPRTRILGFIPGPRLSSAYGYAQALDGTWRGYVKATGDYWRERDDFVDAMDFINWYLTQAVKSNGVSRKDPRNLYLNYHEGLEGFRRKSYQSKKWLVKVAQRVEDRAATYRAQYQKCKTHLDRGWF